MDYLRSEKENIQKNKIENAELKITISKKQNLSNRLKTTGKKSKWAWRLSNRNYPLLRKDKDLAEMETQWYMKVLVAQSCLTLYDPMDCSLPGSSVHGVLQARILEWVAIPFSRGSSWPRDRTWVSCTASRVFTNWATKEAHRYYQCTGNTGEIKWKWTLSVMSDPLQPHGLYPTMLLRPWNFPSKRIRVDCHFLLQRIFSTQGSNLGLPHCRQTFHYLSHWGSPSLEKNPSFISV